MVCLSGYPSKPRLVVTVFRLHIYGLSKWFNATYTRHARTHANTENMRDCHLVARTSDNEVGYAISIRVLVPVYIAVHELVQMTRSLSSTGSLSTQ